jgi:hypothetical protein
MLPHTILVTLISTGWVVNEFWENSIAISPALEKTKREEQVISSEDIAAGVIYALT